MKQGVVLQKAEKQAGNRVWKGLVDTWFFGEMPANGPRGPAVAFCV
jgi:hypothetical protein